MADVQFLSNHFLIAMPGLADPNFFHTVTYICEHDADGAMGIVINRPLDLNLADILTHMDIQATPETAGLPVFQGGPVQTERGFVLHAPLGEWEATLPVSEQIGVTASQDVLAAIAAGTGPQGADRAGLRRLGCRPTRTRDGRKRLAERAGDRRSTVRHPGGKALGLRRGAARRGSEPAVQRHRACLRRALPRPA
jgi:hypothetical protein